MKNIVRGFVLTLVVAGSFASMQTVSASSTKAVVVTRNSAMPTPMCPPGDPNGCGIGQFSGR